MKLRILPRIHNSASIHFQEGTGLAWLCNADSSYQVDNFQLDVSRLM